MQIKKQKIISILFFIILLFSSNISLIAKSADNPKCSIYKDGLCVDFSNEGDYCEKIYKPCKPELNCEDNKCVKLESWGAVAEPTFPSETNKKNQILGFISIVCFLIFISALIILLMPLKMKNEKNIKKYSKKIVALGSIAFSFMFLSSFHLFFNNDFGTLLILFVIIMVLWIIFEFFIAIPYLNISKKILNKRNIILFFIVLFILAQKFLIINLVFFFLFGLIGLLPLLMLLHWSLSQLMANSEQKVFILFVSLFLLWTFFLIHKNFPEEIYFRFNGEIIEKDINLSESPVTFWNPDKSCLDAVPEGCKFIKSTSGNESGWFSCMIGCPK